MFVFAVSFIRWSCPTPLQHPFASCDRMPVSAGAFSGRRVPMFETAVGHRPSCSMLSTLCDLAGSVCSLRREPKNCFIRSHMVTSFYKLNIGWRRGRDLNPRYRCRYIAFPGQRPRPLGDPSKDLICPCYLYLKWVFLWKVHGLTTEFR